MISSLFFFFFFFSQAFPFQTEFNSFEKSLSTEYMKLPGGDKLLSHDYPTLSVWF